MDTELIERRKLNINENRSRETRAQSEVGKQIFNKLCARLAELGMSSNPHPYHSKAIADVIVTPNGADFFFEPQNWEATEWLCRRFSLTVKSTQVHDRIRVLSSERKTIVAEMKAAGFEVLC